MRGTNKGEKLPQPLLPHFLTPGLPVAPGRAARPRHGSAALGTRKERSVPALLGFPLAVGRRGVSQRRLALLLVLPLGWQSPVGAPGAAAAGGGGAVPCSSRGITARAQGEAQTPKSGAWEGQHHSRVAASCRAACAAAGTDCHLGMGTVLGQEVPPPGQAQQPWSPRLMVIPARLLGAAGPAYSLCLWKAWLWRALFKTLGRLGAAGLAWVV